MFKHKSYGRSNLIKAIIFGVAILELGNIFDKYNQSQLTLTLMLFIGILSIVILTGASGQISLGQGALMAVGGYAGALAILNLGFVLWIAILLAVLASLLAGLLLGVTAARLSGPYLAGTTLVIALAIPSLAVRFESVFGGDVGINIDFTTPPPWLTAMLGEIGYEKWQLYVTLPWALLVLFFIANLLSSRTGRSWRAMRDNEVAASLAGIKIAQMKIFVFVISSGVAGLAGILYGLRGIVGPSVYPISLSLMLLTGAILGGIRSMAGAMIGAALVVFLPDLTQWVSESMALSQQVSDYLPSMVASALVVLTLVLNPSGLASVMHHKKGHS